MGGASRQGEEQAQNEGPSHPEPLMHLRDHGRIIPEARVRLQAAGRRLDSRLDRCHHVGVGFLTKVKRAAVVAIASALCVVACSDVAPGPPTGVACLSGASQSCVCPESGASGFSTCDPSFGVMGPCVCEARTPDGLGGETNDTHITRGAPARLVLGSSAGGGVVTSKGYRLQLQIGPALTSGQASSPNYRIQLGILR